LTAERPTGQRQPCHSRAANSAVRSTSRCSHGRRSLADAGRPGADIRRRRSASQQQPFAQDRGLRPFDPWPSAPASGRQVGRLRTRELSGWKAAVGEIPPLAACGHLQGSLSAHSADRLSQIGQHLHVSGCCPRPCHATERRMKALAGMCTQSSAAPSPQPSPACGRESKDVVRDSGMGLFSSPGSCDKTP
jgi:hypothetical protein